MGLGRPTLARARPRNHTSGAPPAQAASPARPLRKPRRRRAGTGRRWSGQRAPLALPGSRGQEGARRHGYTAREGQRLEAPTQPEVGASAGRPAPPVGSPAAVLGLTQARCRRQEPAQRVAPGPAPHMSQLLTQERRECLSPTSHRSSPWARILSPPGPQEEGRLAQQLRVHAQAGGPSQRPCRSKLPPGARAQATGRRPVLCTQGLGLRDPSTP